MSASLLGATQEYPMRALCSRLKPAFVLVGVVGAALAATLATYAFLESSCPQGSSCAPDTAWVWTASLARERR